MEVLLEATARILSKEGTARLSTNRIAQVAGVSVGSLYQYFPNKEALVAELRRRYEEAFLNRLMAAAAGLGALPLREAIHQFMRFLVEIHTEDPGLHNALAEEIPDWELPLIQRIALTYLEAHRDEVRPENLELASRILLQAGEALVHETALRSPELLHNAEFNAEVEELFYRYLRK